MDSKEDEDLAPLVTGCPNCATRFRVTEDQLQVAKGQVRCGACLHVFDGTEHLQVDGEALETGLSDVDELLDELDELDEWDESDEGDEPDPACESEASSAEFESDEFEGLELIPLGEADPEERDAQTSEAEGESADKLEGLPDSEARLEALEQELMADLKGVLASQASLGAEATQAVSGAPGESNSPLKEAVDEGASRPQAESEEEKSFEWMHASGVEQHIELVVAEPEAPVQPELPSVLLEEEKPGRGLGTWLVVLLAIVALPGQVLWFQYDDWVKDDTMRPVYVQLCDLLGCELPLRIDVGLIVAKNSVLRDHPDKAGGLIYDALLVNRASYAQPYPFVELTLTTMNGRLVATRRFRPAEYLGGEAADARMMQPRTPIHISLALQDPGEAPLNFRIRFLPTG